MKAARAEDQPRERYPDFAALIAAVEDLELSQRLRRAETIGRPIGDETFLAEPKGALSP